MTIMKNSNTKNPLVLLLGLTAGIGVAAFAQFGSTAKPVPQTEKAVVGRPGLVLRVAPLGGAGDSVELRISFDYLRAPEAKPKIEGHRFYSYPVLLQGAPTRIGWTQNNDKPSQVILKGVKYLYTDAQQDRFENGSVTIRRVSGAPAKYQVRGVYSYFGQLFILDSILEADEKLLLYEDILEAQPKKE
jgi:hypothetical protein